MTTPRAGSLLKLRTSRNYKHVHRHTKLCPYCPAKFARASLLNRYIRIREFSFTRYVVLVTLRSQTPIYRYIAVM